MLRGLSASAAGMNVAQKRLEGVAHNSATLAAAPRLQARLVGEGVPADAVDGMVDELAAVRQLEANARAAQTQDEMLGKLLDLEV